MKKLLVLVVVVVVVSLCSLALGADEKPKESKATDRVQAAADVLNEIQAAPDSGIPKRSSDVLRVRGSGALDAEGWLHCGCKVRSRDCQLPDGEGMEHPGILHGLRAGASDFRLADRPSTW